MLVTCEKLGHFSPTFVSPIRYVTEESQDRGTLKRFKGCCLEISVNPVRFSKFQSGGLDENFRPFLSQSVPREFAGFHVLSFFINISALGPY